MDNRVMNDEFLFHCTVPIEPIPCVRVTRHTFWTHAAKRYAAYKKELAWEFKKACPPGWKPLDCLLWIGFYTSATHGRLADFDNIGKGICDALQEAGVIKNDNLIVANESIIRRKQKAPYVTVVLKKWEDRE